MKCFWRQNGGYTLLVALLSSLSELESESDEDDEDSELELKSEESGDESRFFLCDFLKSEESGDESRFFLCDFLCLEWLDFLLRSDLCDLCLKVVDGTTVFRGVALGAVLARNQKQN